MRRALFLFFNLLVTLSMFSQVDQKVIIEHFTNSRCGICASRNPAFYETLEDYTNVIHIAYHPSSPYASCIFSQFNPEDNDARTNYYGVYGGTPRVVVQGEVIPAQSPLLKPEQIDEHLGGNADYSIVVSKEQLGGDQYRITITINRVSGSGEEMVLVYAGLAEKEVQYAAPNGEDYHPNVFRQMIYNGTFNIVAGESETITEDYSTNGEWVEDEIYAFAILQEVSSKMVLQAATSLDSPTSVNVHEAGELKDVLYPNPATTKVSIQPKYLDRFVSAEIYALTGNLVRLVENPSTMDISDLLPGLYFVVLNQKDGNRYTARLVRAE